MEIQQHQLETYLAQRHGQTVQINQLRQLGSRDQGAAALKAFGYGRPLHVLYHHNGQREEVVLRRVERNGFGREMASDRLAAVWLDYATFNELAGHVAARDVVGLTDEGTLVSLAHVADFLLLTDYAPGQAYATDLFCLRDAGRGTAQDEARAAALANYLAQIHATRHDDPLLWRRRLRDLVGHGEGIMGLADSYPADFALVPAGQLQAIECAANRWRWQLKPLTHRLCQVHGDFHPFNVLFTQGSSFQLIDRSRGAWGEAADDLSCMSINYLFFSLQRSGRLAPPFTALYHTFWQTYLAQRPDPELCAVIQPWFAWRALVLASPQWYPSLADDVRCQLLTFAEQVLAADYFDWPNINRYLEQA
jgi:hypothetical protein